MRASRLRQQKCICDTHIGGDGAGETLSFLFGHFIPMYSLRATFLRLLC